jgi:ABC-2 type transport system ATP-binding protein
MDTDVIVSLRGVSRRKGVSTGNVRTMILDNLNLEMRKGEILGLIGPNGAGKTTLLKTLVGASLPDHGTVRLFSSSPSDPGMKNRLGFLPEEVVFDGFLTGWEVIRYQARIRGRSWTGIERQANILGERLGLRASLDEKTGKYSRGMKQALGLLIALAHKPDLALLDEPTSALDPRAIHTLREYLGDVRSEGRSALISSHQLSELELLSDTIALLDRGILKAVGRLSDLVAARKEVRVTLGSASVEDLNKIPSGWSSSHQGSSVVLSCGDPLALEPLLTYLKARNVAVVDIETRNSSLEDAFLRHTSE